MTKVTKSNRRSFAFASARRMNPGSQVWGIEGELLAAVYLGAVI